MKPYKGYLLETVLHTVETFIGPEMSPLKHQEWRSRAIRCSDGLSFNFDTEKEATDYIDREGDATGRVRRMQDLEREIESLEKDVEAILEDILRYQQAAKRRRDMIEDSKAELATLKGEPDVQKN